MSDSPSIAVVGGGLGGLATAIALTVRGFEVDVFERTSQLGEVGAGINISPQATKALQAIGLGTRLAEVGNPITGQIQRSMYTGDELVETGLAKNGNAADRFGAPYYTFHRADLLDVLADALDSSRVHLGHRCVGVVEENDGVVLQFDGRTDRRADIVIGADGIHSQVRRHLYGEEDPPQFTGQMVWRAQLDGKSLPSGLLGPHGFCGWIGKGSHMMTYYLRGTDIINITTQSDTEEWVEEGWSIAGDPDEMRASFPGATPQLQQLLDAVTICSKWGLFGRQPSHDWGRGRVQLIGDAAHPMLPNAGQGAAQAFEDAYVLSRWLDALRSDPELALARFRDVRIPRAHAIQRQSLANSKLVHAGDWEQRRQTFEERTRQGDTPLGMNWIYGYEPESEWDTRTVYPLSDPSQAQ
ncbi:FAD-dependent monooxygenase [Rhodococcus sp. T2V]|uniref:FAD-dependent monooxygenase n=1 Tax=Rhodococcus sp. T2V TaxID=3034164 RepID=UPI0023E0904F|nr:FAD-dependent monooxygenase [Rhodococcus sp. T2V]MDF3305345.1 FAD-dependent monooxygenase [Rhodococcus sp. T2V]